MKATAPTTITALPSLSSDGSSRTRPGASGEAAVIRALLWLERWPLLPPWAYARPTPHSRNGVKAVWRLATVWRGTASPARSIRERRQARGRLARLHGLHVLLHHGFCLTQLLGGAELHDLGPWLVLHRNMTGRVVKGIAGLVDLLARAEAHGDSALDHVTPVWALASILRQPFEQRGRIDVLVKSHEVDRVAPLELVGAIGYGPVVTASCRRFLRDLRHLFLSLAPDDVVDLEDLRLTRIDPRSLRAGASGAPRKHRLARASP